MPLTESEELELLELESASAKAKKPSTSASTGMDAVNMGAANMLGLVKPLAPVTSLVEKGIAGASKLTGLGDQGTAQRVLDQPLSELTADTRKIMTQAETDEPIKTALGQGAATLGLGLPAAAAVTGVANYMGAPGSIPEKLVSGLEAGGATLVGGKIMESVGSAGMKGLKALATKVKPGLQRLSDKFAERALGFTSSAIKKAGGIERTRASAKLLQKAGAFKNGTSTEAIAKSVDQIEKQVGPRIGAIYNELGKEARPVVSVDDITTVLDDEIGAQLYRTKEINPAKISDLEATRTMVRRLGGPTESYTLNDLWKLKQDLGAKAFDKGVVNENLAVYQDAWKVVSDKLEQAIQREAQTANNPALYTELQRLDKLYSATQSAGKTLADKLSKLEVSGGGLGDFVAFGAGTAAGHAAGPIAAPALGLAAVAAKRAVAQRGPGAASNAFAKAANAVTPQIERLLAAPHKLGKFAAPLGRAAARGPLAAAVAHYHMSQQYEEYRQKAREVMEEGSQDESK